MGQTPCCMTRGFGPPRGQSLGSAADSRDNKDLEGQRESLVAQAAAESKNYSLLSFCCIMLHQSNIFLKPRKWKQTNKQTFQTLLDNEIGMEVDYYSGIYALDERC